MIAPSSPLINRLGKYSVSNDGVVSFFWTAGGIEFTTTSSSVYLDVESTFEECNQEIWLTIEIDGSLIQRINLPAGKSTICAFRKAEEGIARTVRVLRESQLDTYAKLHALRFHAIHSKDEGGLQLLTPPAHKLNIEFIGDSITSGEGLNGAVGEMSFISAFYGFKNNYACLTADSLDAYMTVSSQSGWGIYCGYNNDINTTMPKIYFTSEFGGEKLIEDRPEKDVIVINLGTNDAFAFKAPGWVDPATSEIYKLRMDSEGNLLAEDLDKIADTGIKFINDLRKINPNAKYIWIGGMIGSDIKPAVEKICQATNIEMLWGIDCQDDQDYGSREHPGAKTHKKMSELLVDKIKTML